MKTPSELQAAILNLPCQPERQSASGMPLGPVSTAYVMGHSDARHAACELVAEYFAGQSLACPECNGRGKSGMVLVHAKKHDDTPLTPIEAAFLSGNLEQCHFCEGTGKVQSIQLLWRRIGAEWLACRKALGIGMRQWAEQVGVLPSEYCNMEAGRVQPDPKCSPVARMVAQREENQP